MNIFIGRNVYFYEKNIIRKVNNYYIIEGKGELKYKKVEEQLEEAFKDNYELGKNLFYKIENVSSFREYLLKDKKKYKIRLLPFFLNKTINNNNSTELINIKSNTFNFEDDLLFNTNNIIEIIDYLNIFSNKDIQEIILDYCSIYGLPYYENVENDILQEDLNSNIPMSINMRDLVLTSITIYILSEIRKYLKKTITSQKILKIMSLNDNSTKNDIENKYNDYIERFQEYFTHYLSNYGNYITPIQFYTNNKNMYIKTCNQIQAISYYFLNYILLGNFSLCFKCYLPTPHIQKGLCEKCYNETPNYLRNEERKQINTIAKEYITKLKNLNNDDINSKISEIDYNFHNPKEDKLFALTELFNSQNIK